MCCQNKKKKQQKQAELQTYMDKKVKPADSRVIAPRLNQSKLSVQPAPIQNSYLSDKPILVQNPQSNVRSSQLTMQKMFQKSQVRVSQIHDPSMTNFFKGCTTDRVQLVKITSQHSSYVRKHDYFDISNNHIAQLNKMRPQIPISAANYDTANDFLLLTPRINKFYYDRQVVDIGYLPKTKQYRLNYRYPSADLKQSINSNHSGNSVKFDTFQPNETTPIRAYQNRNSRPLSISSELSAKKRQFSNDAI